MIGLLTLTGDKSYDENINWEIGAFVFYDNRLLTSSARLLKLDEMNYDGLWKIAEDGEYDPVALAGPDYIPEELR